MSETHIVVRVVPYQEQITLEIQEILKMEDMIKNSYISHQSLDWHRQGNRRKG